MKHDLSSLIEFRRLLHRSAELSGKEKHTAQLLLNFLADCKPETIIKGLGGSGLACIFKGSKPGPTIVFRSELDALPIQERTEVAYRSNDPQASHKCGHDGHMAILAGLAGWLAGHTMAGGRVVLLFQPSEETGTGAEEVVGDPRFQALQPDYMFALHNLPGFPLGQVLIRQGVFTCASTGAMIKLMGASAHAAYPEKAVSPTQAFIEILSKLQQLADIQKNIDLITVVYARLGEIAFGTAPGNAEIMATLRSDDDSRLDSLAQQVEKMAARAAQDHGLESAITWHDKFPTTVNHGDAVGVVKQASVVCGLQVQQIIKPFPWSEDFGQYLARYSGALFCLGAGEEHAPLHHPDYDFPDELLQTGICLFQQISTELLS
jgi:amidohydrolase